MTKIFSHPVDCCFAPWSCAVQKDFSFMRSYLLIVVLSAVHVLFRMPFPVPRNLSLYCFSLLSESMYLVLYWGIWSAWGWILYRVVNMIYLYSTYSHPCLPNICWRRCLFFIVYFWLLCQQSNVYRCMSLCLSLQFDFIDWCVCLYATVYYYRAFSQLKASPSKWSSLVSSWDKSSQHSLLMSSHEHFNLI